MTLVLRLLALLGSPAHAVDRLVGRLLGFLPFRVPGAALAVVLLALAAWGSAEETGRAIAARPQPAPATISDLVDRSTSAWVSVSGLLSGPHLDNSIYASDRETHFLRISDDPHDHVVEGSAPRINLLEFGRRQTIFPLTTGDGVTRWFYVLREDGDDHALVVRSARGEDGIRTRSVVGTVVGSLEGRPHLVELADAGSEPASGSPSDAEVGERITVRGAFTDGTQVSCDTGETCRDGRAWRYRVVDAADPDVTAWVDSPHAPDALPVTLDGVLATDANRMAAVLGTEEMAVALEGLRHRDDLVLADGIGPAIPEASYLGAFLLAGVAVVLAVSAAIPYPIFRRAAGSRPAGLRRPVVEELVGVAVDGTVPGSSGAERLSGAPARIGWLPARELARRAWQLRSLVPDAADDRPRLALLAAEGSFVLPVEPIREHLRVEPGLVATSAAVRHGLRVVGPDVRVMLSFASEADRDRTQRELEPGTAAPPTGPIPEAPAPRRSVTRPWARPATAAALGATAVLVLAGAAAAVVAGDAVLIETAPALAAAAALSALSAGIARRHSLADELLPSAALVGLVVAGVVSVASLGCGTWLTPNVAGCSAFDPIGLVTPVAAVAAFALGLWATPHLARQASA